MGIVATQFEGLFIEIHRHVVGFDGPIKRGSTDRHPTLLPGAAQQKQVCTYGVPENLPSYLGSIDELQLSTHLPGNLAFHTVCGKQHVGILEKMGCGLLGIVDNGVGSAHSGLRQAFVAGRHDQVAAQQQIGLAGGNTNGLDGFLIPCDPDMAGNGAEFLCQPGLVHGGAAFAFDVGGHGDQ